jgi:hypothetical protein
MRLKGKRGSFKTSSPLLTPKPFTIYSPFFIDQPLRSTLYSQFPPLSQNCIFELYPFFYPVRNNAPLLRSPAIAGLHPK